MHDEYISLIITLLHKCDDIEILQIVYHLLQKHKAASSRSLQESI